jgi:hypothetical protein
MSEALHQTIIAAAARAAWVDAWASAIEEAGGRAGGPGVDLMDVAPETPSEAVTFAEKWAEMFQRFNGLSLSDAFARMVANGIASEDDASDFGHYSMMQAMGHGVAWTDDHDAHGYKLPSAAFHADVSVSWAEVDARPEMASEG